jgi:hypothetical protein
MTIPHEASGKRVEMSQLIKLAGLVFPSAGAYQFCFLVDADEKGTLVIDLINGSV